MGPLRTYSTRSLERSIGKYSSAIKSKVASGANAGNVVESFGVRSYIKSVLDINDIINPIIPAPYSSNTYMNNPDESSTSQLWEPFISSCLNSLDSIIEGVPVKSIVKSLKKYHSRVTSMPFGSIVLTDLDITLAARCWIDNRIYSSLFDRRKKKESRRGNHFVMFHSSFVE